MTTTSRVLPFVVVACVAGCGGGAEQDRAAGDPATQPAPAGLEAPGAGIQLSFLVDGDEWVGPATFTQVADGLGLRITARAHRVDAQGNAVALLALWDADDMLALSARHAHEVEMTVLRTGRGTLTVRDRAGSHRLAVTAVEEAGAVRVQIFQ